MQAFPNLCFTRELSSHDDVTGVTLHRRHILCGLCTRSPNDCNMNITFGARHLYSEHFPKINLINPHNDPPREGGLFSTLADEETEVGELPEPARGHTVRWRAGLQGPRKAHPSRLRLQQGCGAGGECSPANGVPPLRPPHTVSTAWTIGPEHTPEVGVGVRGAGRDVSLRLS